MPSRDDCFMFGKLRVIQIPSVAELPPRGKQILITPTIFKFKLFGEGGGEKTNKNPFLLFEKERNYSPNFFIPPSETGLVS